MKVNKNSTAGVAITIADHRIGRACIELANIKCNGGVVSESALELALEHLKEARERLRSVNIS